MWVAEVEAVAVAVVVEEAIVVRDRDEKVVGIAVWCSIWMRTRGRWRLSFNARFARAFILQGVGS